MDSVAPHIRSRMMQAVKGRDTKPEKQVRSALHAAGFRFRLHSAGLPGRPDMVLARYKIAIFVHGCFWHGHSCRRGARPSSNTAFWNAKIERNIARDRTSLAQIKALGWKSAVIWECTLARDTQRLLALLSRRKRGERVCAR
jgi:DNA mismatch endonuclease, patch repair protein